MSLDQAGKGGIATFMLNNREIAPFVNRLQVFETLCKPYLTAKAIIVDADLIIDEMKIVGGEPVTFTFQTEGGGEYSANLQVFSIKKDTPNKNHRGLLFEMDMIGSEYFGDRTQLVQKAFKNITGTDAIKNLHSEYMKSNLQILVDSMGLLFNKNSHVINSVKPFKAIDDLRRQLTFAKYPTGSTVYYRDKDGVKFAPAEYLFDSLSAVEQYIQKTTWGASWRDIADSKNAIVDYTTNIQNNSAGRTKVANISAMMKQEYKVINVLSNKLIFNNLASLIPNPIVAGMPFGQLAGQIMNQINASVHGGSHNYLKIDTQKIPETSVRRTEKENLFKAMLADAPQIFVKVPIQGGLKATVGKGVNIQIMPPIGERETSSEDTSMLSGDALVADLTHDVMNNSGLSSTVMRLVKGGFNG